jgi:hypothetical protein
MTKQPRKTSASLKGIALQAKREKVQARLDRTLRHDKALLQAKLAAALAAASPKPRSPATAALRATLAARPRR